MDFKDYYRTLGVSKTSTDKEIKQAFRKLARKHHPDVNPEDRRSETKFKELNEAYEVIGDSDKRRKYDDLGSNWRLHEQKTQGHSGPFENQGFGPENKFSGKRWTVNAEGLNDQDPFSDFFRTFFGGGESSSRSARTRKTRGRDIEHSIELSLKESFHGVTKRISIEYAGRKRTIDIRLPVGVRNGSRVRIVNKGELDRNGGPAGDLYLKTRIRRHQKFERKGQDLHIQVPISFTTAVLGGEAQVPTLDGLSLRLKIPISTQPGQILRLNEQGMPFLGKPNKRGDLYAIIKIEVPRQISTKQQELYEALRDLENKSQQ